MENTADHSLFLETKNPQTRATLKADFWICLALLLILNIPLLSGTWNYPFTFLPSAVAAGEWWRVFTAPFVHISFYHLLVDGVAFALLYSSIAQWRLGKRLVLLSATTSGGLLIPLWVDPAIQQVGLCGMSGVAHGLMAVCALDLISAGEQKARRIGLISFAVVFVKCAAEAISGRLIFDFVHFGNVGLPIVTCHAGGMLGALIVAAVVTPRANTSDRNESVRLQATLIKP